MGFVMRNAVIRQVKKEIRVLGIAVKPSITGHQFHAVGVVFRGCLWLDGVMRTTAQGPDITDRLVEMIAESPHHPQIRVLLLHDSLIEGGAIIDPHRLSEGTSKPVIAIPDGKWDLEAVPAPGGMAAYRFTHERGSVPIDVLSIGLRGPEASRVLEVSTREGVMPEALRVAGLVVSALAVSPKQNV
jgi:endonuclease V-like protein UPF0215 family